MSAQLRLRLPSPARLQRVVLVVGVIGVAQLATLAALTDSRLPAAWKNWHYSRAIELTPTTAPQLVSVITPLEIYPHAIPWLADVRVIDDQGAEVPYVSFRSEGTSNTANFVSPSRMRTRRYCALFSE